MHQEETTMENPDQTQETRHVNQLMEPETNPVQVALRRRPVANIIYPPTPPTIKEVDVSTRTKVGQISLEEALGDHSDGNGPDDSIMVGTIMVGSLEPEKQDTPAAELPTKPKAQPKNFDEN